MELKLGQRLDKQLSDLILKQISKATVALQAVLDDNADLASSLFVARKRIKRARAVLLLMRPQLSNKVLRRERARLRKMGRRLSGARDAHATVATIALFQQRWNEQLDARTARELGKLSTSQAATAQFDLGRDVLSDVLAELQACAQTLRRKSGKSRDADAVFAEITRSYRSTQQRFRKVRRAIDDDALHDWRKDMQRHRRHMQLVAKCWPEFFAVRALDAARIARLLGSDRDLGLLTDCLRVPKGSSLKSAKAEELLGLISRQQHELRAELIPLADRLLSLRPGELERIIKTSWRAARKLDKMLPEITAANETHVPRARDTLQIGSAEIAVENSNAAAAVAKPGQTAVVATHRSSASNPVKSSAPAVAVQDIPTLRPRPNGVSQIRPAAERAGDAEKPKHAIGESLVNTPGRRRADAVKIKAAKPPYGKSAAKSDARPAARPKSK